MLQLPAMEQTIYTLVRGEDWRDAEAAGAYHGSADDRRDGFLHFSAAAQLRQSAAKHRAGEADLWMVAVSVPALGDALRWEPAAGGSRPGLFPHLYGPLPLSAVRATAHIPLDPDGRHIFPEEIP
ncbi:DUF952 domain-containing protein [Roseomonas mucosa]|nr:DUF952 domain-containing protein [Roseomonas mucosa]MDT8288900.1 DUF952 domain-containing protein [Roseomonas mucosa]MDT8293744.1 DUF952 domain-containing protein [Roseomonas mucosa]MDT8312162.1 DUF952 domain-containing protein [Roseomonas mucosa]MDT8348473.1 DUF952 domain-containing protein [Roseomonas mucosa]MDT8358754.1 DUF952 domain-containing protein [Roseomonas mucosa]